jgi:two-component system, chemotaxis family, protein-glutamate methylesterase/glutaminase
MEPGKIKVLVADDSQVTRMLLVQLLGADPAILVIGAVDNGQAALDFLENRREMPDVVVMDIHMPRLDGFETTRRIMETRPVPIIICTATSDPRELAVTFRSMEAGAVACVEKPVALGPDFENRRNHLVQTVRLMSEVKVVRRWNRPRASHSTATPVTGSESPRTMSTAVTLVGMGASTGGPPVLQTILSRLPRTFPTPLLIVQHIAHGFLPGMVDWLNQTTGLQVHIAAHGAQPLPGHVYVAPDDFHLGIGAHGDLVLGRQEPENGLRPAVSHLFRSLATICGAASVGVLLTGMGTDGAAELKRMKDCGAHTIAQDRESSIVHGMPGEAIELGAAVQILPADKIAGALIAHVTRGRPLLGDVL